MTAAATEIDELPWTAEYSPESQARRPLKMIVDIARDVWAGRELAWRLFVRNLSGSYRQSLLGFLWILVPTIAQAASWTFLSDQRILQFGTIPGGSFLAFIAIGSVLWQGFFDAVQTPLKTVLANQGLITKLQFPRESLVLVSLAEVLFDFLIRMIFVLVICAFTGLSWSWGTLAVPVLMFGLILVGLALGLMLTPVGILYQDIGRTLTVLSPFWMLMTPVVYVAPDNPAYRIWNWINAPGALLSASRDLLAAGATDMWVPALVWLAVALPLLLLGMMWFRLGFRIFIERMAN